MVSHPKKNSAEWFIEQINVENAKLLAVVLVIGFIGYHGLLHLMYGPDSCTWLLMSGRYKGDHEWQPYGCMLHIYSKTDSRRCLRYLAFWGKYNSFAFIGDSRIEQLYEYFIGVLKTRTDADTYSPVGRHNSNYTYIDTKLRLSVSFVWSNDVSRTMVDQFKSWQESDKPPSVIVAGTGLQLIRSRNATDPALEEYKRNLTHLVQAIDSLASRHTQVLWKLVESVDTSKLKQQIVSNVDIDAYNAAAVEILTHSAAKIWNSPRLIVSGAYSDDGISLSHTALRHSAQVVLNMFCNEQMNFLDGSCCSAAEPRRRRQLLLAAAAALCAVLAITKRIMRWTNTIQHEMNGYSVVNQANMANQPSLVAALAKLGVIIAYFYLCDRTNFFMKENKYYSEWSFWLPVGYVFALGLFFTEESRSSRVLHREQTDEWKGWMQLVFLISQVTGASKVLPIYMMVRILISSYLFLSGYGHVYYTWRSMDVSVARFGRVMFRLNFVTLLLCLAMNRPYQFYGFVPLVSFGYTLMFILLSIPPHISSGGSPHTHSLHTLSLVVKILILLTILTVLYMSEVFFQKIFVFKPWKALFVNADDDIRQWWLRWKQDRYSMAAGIIFALAYLLATRHNLVDDNNHNNLFSSGISITATLLAFIGIGSYITYTFFCSNTYDCNEIHSYVAFIPIVSYILLRNVSGALRMRHSSMFAWFGNITLELYISHSHIWLAADTHGILVLIPGAPGLNLILTSYIFVCAAHEVHKLTMVILPHAVPNDWKLVLRNFTIFCTVMVPLGIYDGIF